MPAPFDRKRLWRELGRTAFVSGVAVEKVCTEDSDTNALIRNGYAAAAKRADRKRIEQQNTDHR